MQFFNGNLQWNISFSRPMHDWEVDMVTSFFQLCCPPGYLFSNVFLPNSLSYTFRSQTTPLCCSYYVEGFLIIIVVRG
jgi:hypothetical protein